MCFIDTPKTANSDPERAANAAQDAEMTRRRKAQGYGATLLTRPDMLGPAPLGRATLGGQ